MPMVRCGGAVFNAVCAALMSRQAPTHQEARHELVPAIHHLSPDGIRRAPMTLDLQTRRPLVGPSAWVKAATRCGFGIEPLFRAAGVDLAAAAAADPVVALSDMLRLMRDCTERGLPEHYFPLVLGEAFAFDNVPAIELFLTTSPSMRSSLRAMEWISELIPMCTVRLVEGPELTQLVVRRRPVFELHDEAEGFVATVMMSFYSYVRVLSGNSRFVLDLLTVCFSHAHPEVLQTAQRLFESPVQTRQSFNGFTFPTALLDVALPGGVPDLNRQAENTIRGYLARLASHTTASELLEQRLLAEPDLLGVGVERVADRLGLHPRTLQRRLQDEGLQYSQVIDRVWLQLASQWLQNESTDIDTIGLRLGYASGASFARAFKRVAGVSPGQYRERGREGLLAH